MLLQMALAAARAEDAGESDCALSESDYYALREELSHLRREQGRSIGVAAEGRQCQKALDAVLRNGPFLGVHRVEPGAPESCTAVLRPGAYGSYSLKTVGDCRESRPMGASSPSRMMSLGWWLPYGISARWNEDIGGGLSAVVDMGWQLPAQSSPFDLSPNTSPTGPATTLRPMLGFDLAPREFSGSYMGFRAGLEIPMIVDAEPFSPDLGLVAFTAGRKWMASGFALQAGAGAVAEIPMVDMASGDADAQLAVVYPVIELRAGFTSRR